MLPRWIYAREAYSLRLRLISLLLYHEKTVFMHWTSQGSMLAGGLDQFLRTASTAIIPSS
jgi:hypothetical protein